MLIRKQIKNLLQIFCEISLHSQVIFKSIKVADDISRGTFALSVNGLNTSYGKNKPYNFSDIFLGDRSIFWKKK